LNVTVPVGLAPVTVAVKVTACPKLLGLADDVSAVVVAAATMSDAVAGLPGGASLELTGEVVLTLVPALVAVTLTEIVQEADPASDAPDRPAELPPAVAAMVPPHDPDRPFGVATTNPAGNVSVNATPVMVVVAALVMVKLSDVLPPRGTDAAPKASLIVGAGASTKRDAVAVLPGGARAAVTVTALVFVPTVVPVTLTEIVQEPSTEPTRSRSKLPERLTLPLPAVAVTVPPNGAAKHVPVSPFGVATTSPAGRLSVNRTWAATSEGSVFETVKVSEVVPPTLIDVVANASAIVGVACASAGVPDEAATRTATTAPSIAARLGAHHMRRLFAADSRQDQRGASRRNKRSDME
jgi:hypothetical protein